MDFRFSEEQTMIQDLARSILESEVSLEGLRAVEAGPEWFDRGLWSRLAEAHLLGIAVPEEFGGMGFGLEELCVLLHETGRTVAPVPVLPALLLAGLPIAEFGSEAQRRRWLPALAQGDAVLTAALVDADSDDPSCPGTHAHRDGDAWRLRGRKHLVPAAGFAERILVPAATEASGVGLFLVDPRAEGVRLAPQQISTGETLFELALSDVLVDGKDRLGGEAAGGDSSAVWLHERALIGICATQLGVSERALEITANHARERVQFGVPIGSFQAVQHRTADCFVDLESMRWTTWQACWRLGRGLSAGREATVAKFWAAEGGARIAAAAQHIHAGLGVDLDYPIHRYFLWSRSLELSLGAALPQLARLGREMARTSPQEMP